MTDDLYRPDALEKVSSPEQLDQLVRITRPLGWLGLLTAMAIVLGAAAWGVIGHIPTTVEGRGVLLGRGGIREISSPSTGQVVEVLVREGDVVQEGTVVVRLQPLDVYPATARVSVTASRAGRIVQVLARSGAIVKAGDRVANVADANVELVAFLYLPIDQAKSVHRGMQAQVCPTNVDREEHGFIVGSVQSVSAYVTSLETMKQTLGSDDLVRVFTDGTTYQAAPIEVRVRLETDPRTVSGFRWSSELGPPFRLVNQTVCNARIVTGSVRPINLVVPSLLERFGARQP